MITVWATYRNADMTEGKGPMVLDKVFLHENDAHTYISGQRGIMGRTPQQFGKTGWENMGDWKVEPLPVLDGLDESGEYDREMAVRRAYSKLTQEERDAIEFHVRQNLVGN
jgi:hypothetical protein